MTWLTPVQEYILRGGWIMIPLFACSVVMWTLILERILSYRRLGSSRDLSLPAAIALLGKGTVPEGTQEGLCTDIVRRFLRQRAGNRQLDREILRQCSRSVEPDIAGHLQIIAALAAIAPLLGLLGTVIGMIETFRVISIFGTGNARAMAEGISLALITTQTGLVIAVPGLLLYFLLERRAQRLTLRLEEITSGLIHHV